MKLVAVAILE